MGTHKLTMSMKSKRLFAHRKKNTVLVTVVSLLLESSGQSRKRKKNTFSFWLLPQKRGSLDVSVQEKKVHRGQPRVFSAYDEKKKEKKCVEAH